MASARSLILSVLIILSTMFIKQHSVIDVCLGTTLALFGHLLFYPQRVEDYEEQRSLSHMRKEETGTEFIKKSPVGGFFN